MEMKAYMIGGGIGTLAAAAFMIRDAHFPGHQIYIFEQELGLGGALDAQGTPETGYRLRGGRMLTTDHYECTWDLFRSIPSLENPQNSVFDDVVLFNQKHQSHAQARLIDRYGAKLAVESMGFSFQHRKELEKFYFSKELQLEKKAIHECFSPSFFETSFWYLWSTTFAFQVWHSALECQRYLHRFILEFPRINTLGGVKRTPYNQYDSLVSPLVQWLRTHNVQFLTGTHVIDLCHTDTEDGWYISKIHYIRNNTEETIDLEKNDLVFLQNGSMTDASSFGSMNTAPESLTKNSSVSWKLWENLAQQKPNMGCPSAFTSCIAQALWMSFTVTLKNTQFFDRMTQWSGNEAGTGGLVTFKDSRWLMSVVLPHQPYFKNQDQNVQVFWGYALYPNRVGDFISKTLLECSGSDILHELSGHLHWDETLFDQAICIPCRMPYITSMFMPRAQSDRPFCVPLGSKRFACVSQFVEIADDVVFTVEYSIRAAQTAVYRLLNVSRPVTPITHHDRSSRVLFKALIKSFV